MRKKILNYILVFIGTAVLFLNSISAYNVNSSNNPGKVYGEGSGTLIAATNWPSPYLKLIKIRIFRNGLALNTGGYYSIANSQENCYSQVSAMECRTAEFDYSTTSDDSNNPAARCDSSSKTISLGCIASPNLEDSWSSKSFDGTYVNDYMTENNYENLKAILNGMGYNDSNFKNDDIVIVEPVTLVKCNSNYYVGTSTAMMKKNISYRGISGNLCGTYPNDEWSGYTFSNLFMGMSTAFKYTKSSCSDSAYSGCGYFRYDVSSLGYPEKGNLKVKFVNSISKVQITAKTINFSLHEGQDCSGTGVDMNTSNGSKEIEDLNPGTYSISIKADPDGSPEGYVSRGGLCVVNSLSITTGTTTEQTIEFVPNCQTRLDESNKTVSELLNIYKAYPHNRNLLNFSNPSCSAPTPEECDDNISSNLDLGCLYAKKNIINFNENNLSCYTGEAHTDEYGNYKAFCIDTFSLENVFGFDDKRAKTFYGTSGQFLIKKQRIMLFNFIEKMNS